MSPLRRAWIDYRAAVGGFSRPARQFLLSTVFAWAGYGVNAVLFNLYLVEGGFQEAFVGRTIAANGIGLAVAALPAGWLAERVGRRPCLILGSLVFAAGHLLRAVTLEPGLIVAGSLLAGVGQALTAIAAAPFLSEHSTPRERTHLFSAFFAAELLAGMLGSLVGGSLPGLLAALPATAALSTFTAYRVGLMAGVALDLASVLPLRTMGRIVEAPLHHERQQLPRGQARRIAPIAVNAFLIGLGAGLVIPFMNLYFKTRFDCSSTQIGVFFSVAHIATAFAMLLGPAIARVHGKLRTAIASQLLSLPFLLTLGAEQRLPVAVGAFWLRAAFMQASTPLVNTFVMEVLPPALRARAASVINLVWNLGWATSATVAGWLIERFGYAVPFYITAALYAAAALWFYWSFRNTPEEGPSEPRLSEEAKGLRGEGPLTE